MKILINEKVLRKETFQLYYFRQKKKLQNQYAQGPNSSKNFNCELTIAVFKILVKCEIQHETT